jgi:hypothetical protein
MKKSFLDLVCAARVLFVVVVHLALCWSEILHWSRFYADPHFWLSSAQ